MNKTLVMDKNALHRTIIRLAHEICERIDLSNAALVGIRRGGEAVAERIRAYLQKQELADLPCGGIDIADYRDDRRGGGKPVAPDLGFSPEGKILILCDDVLQTGRSVRAAIDGIFAAGRPKEIRLLVLVDRGGREVPVRADFVGKNVPAAGNERVEVELEELGAEEDRLYLTGLGGTGEAGEIC